MPKGVYERASIEERFWSNIDKGRSGCWPWPRARFRSGYGQFQLQGRPHVAHRIAWTLTNGPIPDGLSVLHHCDNRACVRPDHLWLGTAYDNMRDMVSKGRWNGYRGGRKPGARSRT